MFEFFVIVGAIIVAQIAMVGAMCALLFNKRFLKWYSKKAFEMAKTVQDEMFELEFGEDEES